MTVLLTLGWNSSRIVYDLYFFVFYDFILFCDVSVSSLTLNIF